MCHFNMKPILSSVQTFTYTTCAAQQVTLQPGKYRFEVWGASGGSTVASGGFGGYSKGELTLSESTKQLIIRLMEI
jgi:pyruvate/2-oxoglutarate/acetoin dehydrogenase E1 component